MSAGEADRILVEPSKRRSAGQVAQRVLIPSNAPTSVAPSAIDRLIETDRFIPVCEPVIGDREVQLVTECLSMGSISGASDQVSKFEEAWAAYCGARHGIAVASGTAALQIAVDSLDLEPGDEVILPSFTIISCALAVVRAGATPVLVDCDPGTYCADPGLVAAAITSRTRAIMLVHMYGHPVDVDPIRELADKRGLVIIEDAAQAHGSEYLSRSDRNSGWRRTGMLGHIGIFSFYANKLVTTGEGGMVLTDSDDVADRCRAFRDLAMGAQRFHHERLGYNFRVTGMQAAMGRAQVERMAAILEKKRHIARTYRELLAGLEAVRPSEIRPWARSNHWMNPIVLADDAGIDAFELARRLSGMGVETRPYFKGMHEQPAFTSRGYFDGVRLPVTEHLHRHGLYLPSGLGLTDYQIEKVVGAIETALQTRH